MKFVPIFLVLFLFFLVVLGESPEKREADEKFVCKQEYGTPGASDFCTIKDKNYPDLCNRNCRDFRGAKGGICVKKHKAKPVKCICDYCKEHIAPQEKH